MSKLRPPAGGERFAGRFDVAAHVASAPGYVELRARDIQQSVEVALWWVRPTLHGKAARAAVGADAERLRALVRPGLRRLYAIGEAEGALWVSYQLAAPGPAPRPKQPTAVGQVAVWVRAVATALATAHAEGRVHGRLTPADVVLVSGQLYVGGVGLWRDVDPAAAAVAWRGLDVFLAPEVRAGAAPTPAADVWSVAASAAALIAGVTTGPELERALGVLGPAFTAALATEPAQRIGLAELAARADEAAGRAGASAGTAEAVRSGASIPVPRIGAGMVTLSSDGSGPVPIDRSGAIPVDRSGAIPRLMGRSGPIAVDRSGPIPVDRSGPIGRPPSSDAAAIAPPSPDRDPASGDPDAFSAANVTGALARVKAVAPGQLHMMSMRPPEAAGPDQAVPVAVPGDDTRRQVQLRAMSDAMPRGFAVKPGALGYMAPPRAVADRQRRTKIIAIAFGVAMVIGAIVIGSFALGGERPAAVAGGGDPAPAPVAIVAIDAAPVAVDAALARGCTDAMRPIGAACIDPHEAPGAGRLPDTGVRLDEAAAACAARQLRLCTAVEWRAACAGAGGAAWPYGAGREAGACNLAGARAAIARAGSFPRCVSAAGAHDMSGNVAEWVADGSILGGSSMDGGDGRCDAPARAVAPGASAADVGFRCCGDR